MINNNKCSRNNLNKAQHRKNVTKIWHQQQRKQQQQQQPYQNNFFLFSMAIHDFISVVWIGVYMQSITIHSTCYVFIFICFRRPKMEIHEFMILRWDNVRSFIHCLCRRKYYCSSIWQFQQNEWAHSVFSGISLSLSFLFFLRYICVCVWYLFWLYWKSTCNMNITFRNLGSFHSLKTKQRTHTQYAICTSDKYDWFYDCACVLACKCVLAFFVSHFLFRLKSFTDYSTGNCSVAFFCFWHGDTWMKWMHASMNEWDPNIHSHFVKMAFSQVKAFFSLWKHGWNDVFFSSYIYDYIWYENINIISKTKMSIEPNFIFSRNNNGNERDINS